MHGVLWMQWNAFVFLSSKNEATGPERQRSFPAREEEEEDQLLEIEVTSC